MFFQDISLRHVAQKNLVCVHQPLADTNYW